MLGLVIPKVSWMNSEVNPSFVLVLQLDPRLLVERKRVHQNSVVIENGKKIVLAGRHISVLMLMKGWWTPPLR